MKEHTNLQPHKGSSETITQDPLQKLLLPLQPHEGSSETVLDFRLTRQLQPHNGSSETFRENGDVLQPHKASSETPN